MKFIRTPFSYTYKNAAIIIAVINVGVFFISQVFPQIFPYVALTPIYTFFGRMYWQVFTYQFFHAPNSVWHLLFNMLPLVIFGIPLEKKIGSKEFVLFYLLSGTLTGVLSAVTYLTFGLGYISVIGASGVVFAVLFVYAVLFPRSVIALWGIVPIPAPYLILGYAVLEILFMFSNDSIAHLVHLFGLVIAWLYVRIRFGLRPFKIWGIIK